MRFWLLISTTICLLFASLPTLAAPDPLQTLPPLPRTLPNKCSLESVKQVDRSIAVVYACVGGPTGFRLERPDTDPNAVFHVPKFSVYLSSGHLPTPEMLNEFENQLRAPSLHWDWPIEQAQPLSNQCIEPVVVRETITRAEWFSIFGSIGLAIVLLLVSRTHSTYPTHPLRERWAQLEPISKLAWGIVLVTWLFVLAQRAHAAFTASYRLDDFMYLVFARRKRWWPDDSIRFMSVTVLFQLLEATRSHLVAAIASLACIGFGALQTYRLLRVLEFERFTALLAIVLASLAPGELDLVNWASGLQHLAVYPAVLSGILAFEAILRSERDFVFRHFAALVAWSMIGMLCKFPVAIVLCPSVIWWFVCRGSRKHWARATIAIVSILLSQLALVGVHHWSARHLPSEYGKFGMDKVIANLREFVVLFFGLTKQRLWMIGVLGLFAIIAWSRRVPTHRMDPLPHEQSPKRNTHPIVQWLKTREANTTLLLIGLVCVWMTPFLLNRIYFATYYSRLMFLPLAALVAQALTHLHPQQRVRDLIAAVVTLYLVVSSPDSVRWTRAQPDIEAMCQQLATQLHGRRAPKRILLESNCLKGGRTAQGAREVDRFFQLTENGFGVQWATGWLGTEVLKTESADGVTCDDLHVSYCPTEGFRIVEPK